MLSLTANFQAAVHHIEQLPVAAVLYKIEHASIVCPLDGMTIPIIDRFEGSKGRLVFEVIDRPGLPNPLEKHKVGEISIVPEGS